MLDSDTRDQAMEMSRSLVPKGDRTHSSRGALFMAIPDRGCPERKCVRSGNHDGPCWPRED